ncbi:MAG TPA: class I SAM-dependent methyltransferase [Candidatus Micrarchaeaceae archaeon]|nr:class I SAM-dependent methyltransferase [Candidatus Micrarchaeaceae archaeon]
MTPTPTSAAAGRHWDAVYQSADPTRVSWYQAEPVVSLELIESAATPTAAALIDVGGGASKLVDRLIARGFRDLSVLDVSARAIASAQSRLGREADSVSWIRADLLAWRPTRQYDLWHDRAVFHFLVGDAERELYLSRVRAGVAPGGKVVVATFAADGPDRCSNLPVCRYGPDDLVREFGSGFEPIATRREEHITPGGTIQPFTWVVLRHRPWSSGADSRVGRASQSDRDQVG